MEGKKVAIITGAASGIGLATALRFAAGGYALCLADQDNGGLDALAGQLKGMDAEFLCITGDLALFSTLEEIIQKTTDKWGRIDALISSAAWRTLETMRTISLEDWEKTLRICLTAPAFLARLAAEVMEKNKRGGVIIHFSSVMAHRAGGTSPAYTACKGAIESLTYELAVLYGPAAIRVVALSPGSIDTQLSQDYINDAGKNISHALAAHANDLTPLGRAGTPAEVARTCFWLCSEEASFITGTTLAVDGGLGHNFNAYPFKKMQLTREF